MHNTDLKILFHDRPNDSIVTVAKDLLKIIYGDDYIGNVIDINAFADRVGFNALWEYFKANPDSAFFRERLECSNLDYLDIAEDYLWGLIYKHQNDLEMIVALSERKE